VSNSETLIRAAELLEELARDIYDCNTSDDKWPEDSKTELKQHEELIDVACELRRMAKS
jgi:hypothetical protein